MKRKNLFLLPLTILMSIVFVSCDSKKVFDENKKISDEVWDADEKISFEVTITDTITPHNFYVNVRNSDGYPYSNIYIFINTVFPDGKSSRDTLECILADETGKWLGDGLGDIWDNQILFKKNVRFPLSGKYTFVMEQAMRTEHLPLILDVGLRIEKQN